MNKEDDYYDIPIAHIMKKLIVSVSKPQEKDTQVKAGEIVIIDEETESY